MLVLGKNLLHGATVPSGEAGALSRRRLAAGQVGQPATLGHVSTSMKSVSGRPSQHVTRIAVGNVTNLSAFAYPASVEEVTPISRAASVHINRRSERSVEASCGAGNLHRPMNPCGKSSGIWGFVGASG